MNQPMNFKAYTQQENEFFAENELIQIIPNFREDTFQFISGDFGPFRPAKPVTVPLWLALYLKSRNKCQMQLPKWLDYDYLVKVKSVEKEQSREFCDDIPYYYYEIANLLLLNCQEEFSTLGGQQNGAQKVRSAIEDIYELRKEKMMSLLKTFEPETPLKFFSTCGAVDINQVRQSMTAAYSMDQMQTTIEQTQSDDTVQQV